MKFITTSSDHIDGYKINYNRMYFDIWKSHVYTKDIIPKLDELRTTMEQKAIKANYSAIINFKWELCPITYGSISDSMCGVSGKVDSSVELVCTGEYVDLIKD